MKRMSWVILTVCMILTFSCALAQEWAPPGVYLGGSRTPLPMPEGVWLTDINPEFTPSLPEGYYLSDAEYDGQAFILLYRDTAEGGQEILMSVVQEEVNPHALNYVEGSYEGSGKKFLYFMLINGQTLHGSLFLFSLEDNRMNLVLEEPCSNNMVLFDHPPADIEGLSWVLWKDYILPIKLSDGSSYEGGAASIGMLGGMPRISGDFFAGGLVDGQIKYSYLTPVDSHVLKVSTVIMDSAYEIQISIVEQYYDCLTKELILSL